jgi:excisionase family DNA binding protein
VRVNSVRCMDIENTRRAAYRPVEVAQLLGVDVTTVRAWLRHGHLNSTKIGGTRLISRAEIDRLLASAR